VAITAVVVLAGAVGFLLWWKAEETVEPRQKDGPAAQPTAAEADGNATEREPGRAVPGSPPAEAAAPNAPPVQPPAPADPVAPPKRPPGGPSAASPDAPPETAPEQAPPADLPEPPTPEPSVPAPPPSGPAVYLGAEACAKCHPAAEATWEKMRHAAAWEGLPAKFRGPDAKDEAGRACVSCHVTGYGDEAQGGFVDDVRSPHLLGVQCEACHGPGSLHREAAERVVTDPGRKEKTFRAGEARFIVRKPAGCANCHDPHADWSRFKAER